MRSEGMRKDARPQPCRRAAEYRKHKPPHRPQGEPGFAPQEEQICARRTGTAEQHREQIAVNPHGRAGAPPVHERQLRPGNPITKVKSPSFTPFRLMAMCFFTFKGTFSAL